MPNKKPMTRAWRVCPEGKATLRLFMRAYAHTNAPATKERNAAAMSGGTPRLLNLMLTASAPHKKQSRPKMSPALSGRRPMFGLVGWDKRVTHGC